MSQDFKRHPSFANLYIGRSFCSGKQTLFGSSIKHSDVITLKISPASLGRNLHEDHVYQESVPYIEIDMSQAQFAQAITSLNQGEGTPVTLRRLNGQYIEPCPFEDKRMQFDDEFSQEKIISAFHKVQMELGSNMPFMFSQFNRQMEKTVTEAKAEVEGHIQSRLNDMALRGMQLENGSEHMPVIEEAYNSEDIDEDFDEIEDEGMQMGGM